MKTWKNTTPVALRAPQLTPPRARLLPPALPALPALPAPPALLVLPAPPLQTSLRVVYIKHSLYEKTPFLISGREFLVELQIKKGAGCCLSEKPQVFEQNFNTDTYQHYATDYLRRALIAAPKEMTNCHTYKRKHKSSTPNDRGR